MEQELLDLKELGIDERTLKMISQIKPEWFIRPNKKLYVIKKMKPQVLQYYENTKTLHSKYLNDKSYIRLDYFSILCGLSYQDIISKFNKEISKEHFVKVPRLKPDKKNPTLDPFYVYYLKKELLNQEEFNYRSLTQVASILGLTSDSLYRWEKRGLLPKPKFRNGKGTGYYDCVEIKKLVPFLLEHSKQRTKKGNYDVLNENQQKLISEFIFFRQNGGTLRNSNGVRIKKYVSKPDRTLKDMKEDISSVFFLIICFRCEIYHNEIKNYDSLSDENKKRFKPDVFDPISVVEKDYFYLSNHRKTGTLIGYSRVIDQFYSWLLRNLDLDYDNISDLDGFKKFKKYKKIQNNINNFLEQFPKNRSEGPETEIVNQKTKTYLTREQMILVKKKILSDPKSKEPFKIATLWQFCCSTAIRPEETLLVKIEHFLLDDNGYLKLNERGWGILDLPSWASKHGRSPSNKSYKTPIPPETVFQINEYLRRVYKKQENIGLNSIGRGYLFHPFFQSPELPYKSRFFGKYLRRIRGALEFLSQAQRHDFILKSSRHSLNNLLDGYKVTLPIQELNGKVQKVAADLQMRHKPAKDIGEQCYTEIISEDDFYQVLDLTINFPWDLEKLEKWEIEKEYRKPFNGEENINTNKEKSEKKSSEIQQLKNQLSSIEIELTKYKKRPKELSPLEWSKITKELRQKKEQIKQALQQI